jgi:hypothetical protein
MLLVLSSLHWPCPTFSLNICFNFGIMKEVQRVPLCHKCKVWRQNAGNRKWNMIRSISTVHIYLYFSVFAISPFANLADLVGGHWVNYNCRRKRLCPLPSYNANLLNDGVTSVFTFDSWKYTFRIFLSLFRESKIPLSHPHIFSILLRTTLKKSSKT